MRVPERLARQFEAPFEAELAAFLVDEGLLESADQLGSDRFLNRSVLPHLASLSDRFNRIDDARAPDALYWRETSNRENLRLAYFLAFGPYNQMRAAAVWAELARLGWRWNLPRFRAIEWGAGPAAAATGIARAEALTSTGLPTQGTWALLDRDRGILELGARWAQHVFAQESVRKWDTQIFTRSLNLEEAWLPRTAPRFDLWVESFFLNELWGAAGDSAKLDATAKRLLENWDRHLNEEGLVILIEPALRSQSRTLLELRKRLIPEFAQAGLQILLPCLGHQACGALVREDDWCHEEIAWWRAPYLTRVDQLSGRDHRHLDFSYLVIAKSQRPIEELLPALQGTAPRYRLVSPSTKAARDREFFMCGPDGKRRARLQTREELERGDVLGNVRVRGDAQASRVEQARRVAAEDEAAAASESTTTKSETEAD